MKLISAFLLTIILFVFLFYFTLIIENQYLFLGFGNDTFEVKRNNKIPLHKAIFVDGLIIVLSLVNLLGSLFNTKSTFVVRVFYSNLTILLIYGINWKIYGLLDIEVLSLFYHPRGMPATGFFVSVVFVQNSLLLLFEFLVRLPEYKRLKSRLNSFK